MTFEQALWLVKFLHVATISVWAAGIICLPFLLMQRSDHEAPELHRLHWLVRTLYVNLASPAAFVAVGSGIALIFMRETFVEWFSAKLVAVGVLAILHVLIGLLIIKVFQEEDSPFGVIKASAMTTTAVLAVIAILWLVLAKPDWDLTTTAALFEPGGLQELLEPLIAWATR